MNDDKTIHLLVRELIPVINDLDDEPKQIILDHIKNCDDCMRIYTNTLEFEESMPALEYPDNVELRPLKKLVQFNTGLKLLLIAIRVMILIFILYSSFGFSSMNLQNLSFMQSALFLFYTPAAIFLLVFTFTFFDKKWLWTSLLADLFVIIFLNKILQLFF